MTTDRILAARFHLQEVVGRGGMAEVYEAYDANLDRRVAIKVLLTRFTTDDAFQDRFAEEGRRAAGLNHPNIVTVLDTGTDRDSALPFIVMELIQGRSLAEAIAAGGLTEERALEVTADVAAALDYAHGQGLVHRDIKPGNILLAEDGTVKVTDFGIARAIDSDSNVTQTAAVLGTAAYLSPEQAQGRAVDARSDVYSLGVVLYELLTGSQPFQGDTAVTVAYQHVQEPPRPPRDLQPGVSSAAEAIAMRAMAKNPANRYQSAAEMRDDLLRALAGEAIDAPAVLHAEDTALLDPVGPATGPRGSRRGQRRRAMGYILLGLGTIAAAALAVFLLLQLGGDPPVALRTVPNVVRATVEEAQTLLRAQGLDGTVVGSRPSADIEQGLVAATNPQAGEQVADGTVVQLFTSSGPEEVAVPPIVGLPESEANELLAAADLRAGRRTEDFSTEHPEGTIISSNPAPGNMVAIGSAIDYVVSNGEELVRVSNVVLQSEATARQILGAQGLDVAVEEANHDTVEPGIVFAQVPAAGEEVPAGATVTITVSIGPEQTEEPEPPPPDPSPTNPFPTPTPSPTPPPSPTPSPSPPPPSPTPTAGETPSP